MKECIMKLEDLRQPERNVRIHTEQQLKEFEKSIKMFGQIRPIVIDENNVILAGNGLYQALVRMGASEAKVYQYDDLTENQKKKLMIADNKIFALGIENLETLNEFLEELQGDLDIPGFDEEILKQMVADADEVTARISGYGTLDDEEIMQIRTASERREQKEAGVIMQPPMDGPLHIPSQEGATQETAPEANAEMRRFVICPECGKQIWL